MLTSTDVLKRWIHQIDKKQTIVSFSNFYGKISVGFCHNTRKPFFSFKTNRNFTWNFQNGPPFQRLACFYTTITGNSVRFQYCNFETNFQKNENL